MVMLLAKVRSRMNAWWAVHAVLVALVTLMWWPTLFKGKSLIQGDSLVLSLSLLNFLKQYLHGGPSPLWVGQIYGGHPLFAEGQGAFAEPLNLFIAWAFPSVLGSNVFHYVCMLASGAGVIQLCRTLERSAWAAGFAGLAVTFSSCWIYEQNNMTIAGALLWAPWTLLAFERWLASPTMLRAMGMSLTGCMLVFAGYPQVLHGLALFICCRLIVMPFSVSGRESWRRHGRLWLATGAFSVVLCLGLSAIQSLPTLELATWSHRSGGVELAYRWGLASYLRGMLFPLNQPEQVVGAGSLLVCLLACLSLCFAAQYRCWGYVLATALMLILSMGPSSRLFRLLYDAHAIPGLHFFRVVQIYGALAVMGLGILAAFAIDGLQRWLFNHPYPNRWGAAVWGCLLAFLGAWVLVACKVQLTRDFWPTFAIVAVAFPCIIGLAVMHRSWVLPSVMLLLMVVQCIGPNLHGLKFYNAPELHAPSVLDALPEHDPRDRKLYIKSIAIVYGLLDSYWPQLDYLAARAMASDAGQSNLLRGDWSFDGELALELRNRELLFKPIADEVDGHGEASLGARLLDVLAIHYIVADDSLNAPGFHFVARDTRYGFSVYENIFARPFLQVYGSATEAPTADDALMRLRVAKNPQLIVQRDPDGASLPPADPALGALADVHVDFIRREAGSYAMDVQAPFACWIFLADANYPGWQASIDGQPATVWTAQVLGKAVHVPSGTHHVTLTFRSSSFRIGMFLSLLSLLVMVVLLVVSRYRWTLTRRKYRESIF